MRITSPRIKATVSPAPHAATGVINVKINANNTKRNDSEFIVIIFYFNKNVQPYQLSLILYNQKCKRCNKNALNYELYFDYFENLCKTVLEILLNDEIINGVKIKDKISIMRDYHQTKYCYACKYQLH